MKSDGSTRLSCAGLSVSVPGRNLIADLTIDVCPGEILAVLGPNGVGKSLALHTLAGLRPIQSGAVKLNDNNIGDVARQQIATKLALLPQYTEDIFPATVFDTVLVGRHPHVGKFHWESDEDRDIARDALRQLDLADLAGRDVTTLSGGERQRLAVAQVLTQATQIYLLDEPTNHLDPQHQLDVLQVFAEKARQGNAIVATLHDVNLAARFAHRCLLLYGDGRWDLGLVEDVLTGERLSRLYATPMDTVPWRDTNLFVAAGGPAN